VILSGSTDLPGKGSMLQPGQAGFDPRLASNIGSASLRRGTAVCLDQEQELWR